MTCHNGTTRTVFLTKKWAIKVPSLVWGWKHFLYGLIANMQEVDWSGFEERLCPVKFSLPLGIALVMPRCAQLTDDEFAEIEASVKDILIAEAKSTSYGRLNGKVVAFDYGDYGKRCDL